ncbi:hypothetical protein PFISCL1PPCAC_11567, partial [Pristionchus fissidentatus]
LKMDLLNNELLNEVKRESSLGEEEDVTHSIVADADTSNTRGDLDAIQVDSFYDELPYEAKQEFSSDGERAEDAVPDFSSLFPPQSINKRKRRSQFTRDKVNMTENELRCVRCEEYTTHSLDGYIQHLKNKHGTTAEKEGLIFRCACGNERGMRRHFTDNKCPGAEVTIIRCEPNTVDRKRTESELTTIYRRKRRSQCSRDKMN